MVKAPIESPLMICNTLGFWKAFSSTLSTAKIFVVGKKSLVYKLDESKG